SPPPWPFPHGNGGWEKSHVAVVGESSRDLLGRSVPAGHVVDDDHARMGAGAKRTREIRIDLVTLVPADQDRLGKERLVRHGVPPPTTWPTGARARTSR